MMFKNERKELNLAGMLGPDSTSLERHVPSGGWLAPTVVHLDETATWLIWGDLPKNGLPWMRIRHPGPKMLEDFIRLSEAPAEQFLKYARQWGMLMRCRHGLSYGLRNPSCDECQTEFSMLVVQGTPLLQEPVALWKQYAREMRSILNLAAALHQDKLGNVIDWEVVLHRYPKDNALRENIRKTKFQSLVTRQSYLASIIRDLALHADVQILFDWNPYQSPSITLGGSLLGALVIQVMCAVSRVDGLSICNSCGRPFLPIKQRRIYCPDCGIKAAWVNASNKYRTTPKFKKHFRKRKEYHKLYYRLVTRGGMTLENFRREWQKEMV